VSRVDRGGRNAGGRGKEVGREEEKELWSCLVLSVLVSLRLFFTFPVGGD
jgi:hypothetical protein